MWGIVRFMWGFVCYMWVVFVICGAMSAICRMLFVICGVLFVIGVIDPAKVTRCAMQNAASVAGMVLTTQAIVVEKAKRPAPRVPQVPGMTM